MIILFYRTKTNFQFNWKTNVTNCHQHQSNQYCLNLLPIIKIYLNNTILLVRFLCFQASWMLVCTKWIARTNV